MLKIDLNNMYFYHFKYYKNDKKNRLQKHTNFTL